MSLQSYIEFAWFATLAGLFIRGGWEIYPGLNKMLGLAVYGVFYAIWWSIRFLYEGITGFADIVRKASRP